MGALYRRDNSRIWWAKYYVNGRPIRESTGAELESEAKRFLKEREGRVASGAPILPRADRIRYDELAQDLRDYYRSTNTRDLKEAETRLRHLDRFFTHQRVAAIGPAVITTYVVERQDADAANATINRELSTLSRMLRLGYRNGKVLRLPPIDKLKEAAPRKGFFEREMYNAVRRNLPEDVQVALAIAHALGWRMQSEVLTLERRQLDLEAGTLRLDAGQTKNDEGREARLTTELRSLLEAQLDRVEALQKRLGKIVPYLFPYLTGKQRAGTRRKDFEKLWRTACARAGVPGMLRHDCRRTAVRNMVNAGVPERAAMKVTGHKTRSVFDRYHIVSPADLEQVAQRLDLYQQLEEHRAALARARGRRDVPAGTVTGTVTVPTVDPRRLTRENYGTRP